MLESGTTEDLFDIVELELLGTPLLAVGRNGTILHTTDLGATWTQRPSGTGADLYSLADFGFWAVGDSGTIVGSSDSGTTWTRRPTDTAALLRSVSAAFTKYAVGDGGTVLRTSNQGNSWYSQPSGRAEDLYGTPLFGSADIVVGDGGLHPQEHELRPDLGFSSRAGRARILEEIEYSANNTSRATCVGANGTILKTTDSGSSWGQQESGTTADLRSVFFYLNELSGWAAGDGGIILHTRDGADRPFRWTCGRPRTRSPRRAPWLSVHGPIHSGIPRLLKSFSSVRARRCSRSSIRRAGGSVGGIWRARPAGIAWIWKSQDPARGCISPASPRPRAGVRRRWSVCLSANAGLSHHGSTSSSRAALAAREGRRIPSTGESPGQPSKAPSTLTHAQVRGRGCIGGYASFAQDRSLTFRVITVMAAAVAGFLLVESAWRLPHPASGTSCSFSLPVPCTPMSTGAASWCCWCRRPSTIGSQRRSPEPYRPNRRKLLLRDDAAGESGPAGGAQVPWLRGERRARGRPTGGLSDLPPRR